MNTRMRQLKKRVKRLEKNKGEYYSTNESFIMALGFDDLTPFMRKNPDGTTGYDLHAALSASVVAEELIEEDIPGG